MLLILNRSGSMLVTTLVSVLVISILGVTSAGLFFQTSKSENIVRQVSRCEEASKAILNSMRSRTFIETIAPLGPNELSQITLNTNPYNQYIDLSTNPVTIHQQRRLGGMLIDLENILRKGKDASGADYCVTTSGGKPDTTWLSGAFEIADVPGEMSNIKATLRVQYYDLVTGELSCRPTPVALAPLGQQSPARAIASHIVQQANDVTDRLAYKVTVSVAYNGFNQEQKGCTSEALFRYPRVNDTGLNSGSATIQVAAPSMCQGSPNPGTLTLNPPTNWSQKGIIPLCRDTSVAGSGSACAGGPSAQGFTASDKWVPCHLVTMCGQAPSSFSYNSNGSITVGYNSLPWQCTASVDMQYVDVAWNGLKSPFSSSNVVQLPGCDSCGNYGWLGGSFCGSYTSYCSPPPPPPPAPTYPTGSGGGEYASSLPPDYGSDAWFIRSQYNQILGRDPEVSGASFWEVALQTGAMSRNDIINGIATSVEARINSNISVSQYDIDMAQNSWNQWNATHNITNPSQLCNNYSTCSNNFGNTGLSSVPGQ